MKAKYDFLYDKDDKANYINQFYSSKNRVLRLGHSTHVTDEIAKTMAKMGIMADINLASNIATSAYIAPAINVESNILSQEYSLLYEKAANIFLNHGLLKLLKNKVVVVLSTDGQGIEHSRIEREYKTAKETIK